jgi:sec-independent protein translocase protein TatA
MGWDAPWHWVVLAILVIALFGYKKLPDAARAMGRSLRIFKTEIKGMSEDDKAREAARSADRDAAPPPKTPPPAVEPPAPPSETAAPAQQPATTPAQATGQDAAHPEKP